MRPGSKQLSLAASTTRKAKREERCLQEVSSQVPQYADTPSTHQAYVIEAQRSQPSDRLLISTLPLPLSLHQLASRSILENDLCHESIGAQRLFASIWPNHTGPYCMVDLGPHEALVQLDCVDLLTIRRGVA